MVNADALHRATDEALLNELRQTRRTLASYRRAGMMQQDGLAHLEFQANVLRGELSRRRAFRHAGDVLEKAGPYGILRSQEQPGTYDVAYLRTTDAPIRLYEHATREEATLLLTHEWLWFLYRSANTRLLTHSRTDHSGVLPFAECEACNRLGAASDRAHDRAMAYTDDHERQLTELGER